MAKCQKLVLQNHNKNLASNRPSIYLGLVVEENDFFLKFRTAKHTYMFNKSQIISIEDTDEEFTEKKDGDDDGRTKE